MGTGGIWTERHASSRAQPRLVADGIWDHHMGPLPQALWGRPPDLYIKASHKCSLLITHLLGSPWLLPSTQFQWPWSTGVDQRRLKCCVCGPALATRLLGGRNSSQLFPSLASVEALGCLWWLRSYCCAVVLPARPSPEDYGAELLRKYHENLSEVLTDNQVLLKVISRARSLAPGDREVSRREGNTVMYTHIYIFL